MTLRITNINATVFIEERFASFSSTLIQTNQLVITNVQFGEPTPRNAPPSADNGFLTVNNWLHR